MKPAYYNEIDSFCVEWLRNLIKAGLIADGVVDNRSIVDVTPNDLKDFGQCHFFAGIGVWSFALRRSGWSDSREVWTGSCPCQPFSSAGVGNGFADERHLWPYFHYLIEQRRPATVFGEQVASSDGLGWLDLVQSDLEGALYAFAATDLCSAGVGAPHIRQRLYFVARSLDGVANPNDHEHIGTQRRGDGIADGKAISDGSNLLIPWQSSGTSPNVLVGVGNADDARLERHGGGYQATGGRSEPLRSTPTSSELGGLADTDDLIAELIGEIPRRTGQDEREIAIRHSDLIGLADTECEQHQGRVCIDGSHSEAQGRRATTELAGLSATHGLGYSELHGPHEINQSRREDEERWMQQPQGSSDFAIGLADTDGGESKFITGKRAGPREAEGTGASGHIDRFSQPDAQHQLPNPTNGYWSSVDWLGCRDGKFRPVEPCTFPLVNGASSRVGRLRAYGNAINAENAITFIKAASDGLFGLDLI